MDRSVRWGCALAFGLLTVHPGTGRGGWQLAVALVNAQEQSAAAAPAPTVVSAPHRPGHALVVSGGVSLGSYEAGFVYYLTNALRTGSPGNPYSVVTGASAGSINALLGALAGCNDSIEYRPENSVFYQTWIPVDVKDLWRPDKITNSSLFDSTPLMLAIDRVKAVVKKSRWQTDCRVQLGVVATRLRARDIVLKHESPLTVARHSEKFMLSLQASAEKITVSNPTWLKPGERALFPRLGTDPSRVSIDDLFTLLRASAAFPFAFEPVYVTHQLFDQKHDAWTVQGGPFVDGGVFENLPVRLAWRLQHMIESHHAGDETAKASDYIVLDPDSEGWDRQTVVQDAKPESSDLLPMVARFGGEFLRAARTLELLALIEDDPELCSKTRNLLHLPVRRSATASGHFANFLGFFDEDFRIFDFYLGMLDARAFVTSQGIGRKWQVAGNGQRTNAVFECFVDFDTASNGFSRTPLNPPVSCQQLQNGQSANLVALLNASVAYKLWTQSSAYDSGAMPQLEKWFALVAQAGFRARPNEHSGTLAGIADGDEFVDVVRSQLEHGMNRMAEQQETFGWKVKLSLLGKAGLESLRHREPRLIAFVGMHQNRGFELGGGVGLASFDAVKLRLDLGARAVGFGTVYRLNEGAIRETGFRPTFYADIVAAPPWNGSLLQHEIGIGGLAELPVAVPALARWDSVAKRFGFQGSMSLIALQRVYLKANYAHFLYTDFSSGARSSSATPLEKSWTWDLSLGIRALFK